MRLGVHSFIKPLRPLFRESNPARDSLGCWQSAAAVVCGEGGTVPAATEGRLDLLLLALSYFVFLPQVYGADLTRLPLLHVEVWSTKLILQACFSIHGAALKIAGCVKISTF